MHIKGYVNAPLFGIKPVKLVANDMTKSLLHIKYHIKVTNNKTEF